MRTHVSTVSYAYTLIVFYTMTRIDDEGEPATKNTGMSAPRMGKHRDRILGRAVLNTLLWLSWPIILANLIRALRNFVNALWLGRPSKESQGSSHVKAITLILIM